jgi:HPt (histidine-containing phosphotransfer) domain-containing protein
MENDLEIWDEAGFNNRVSNHRPLAESLVGLFLTEAPKHIDAIDNGIGSGDCNEVFQVAHKLKGASANLSAMRLKQVALLLEQAGRDEDTEQFGPLTARIKTEMTNFLDVLKGEYPNLF